MKKSREEIARMMATKNARYGVGHMKAVGKMGAQKLLDLYGTEWMSILGQRRAAQKLLQYPKGSPYNMALGKYLAYSIKNRHRFTSEQAKAANAKGLAVQAQMRAAKKAEKEAKAKKKNG